MTAPEGCFLPRLKRRLDGMWSLMPWAAPRVGWVPEPAPDATAPRLLDEELGAPKVWPRRLKM